MSTCKDVVQSSYRRSGVIPNGVTPSAAQSKVGLERLKGLYGRLQGDGTLGRLTDYNLLSGNYTAQENQRIHKVSALGTITFPTQIRDVSTGLMRAPLDGAMVVVADPNGDGDPDIRIYDANRARWEVVQDLTLNSYAPLTGRYDEHIKNMLAVMLADDAGNPISPMLARLASTARMTLSTRFDRAAREVVGSYM